MNITVIGAGKSGFSAAVLAKEKGNQVFLTESAPEAKFKDTASKLKSLNIEYEFGFNSEKALLDCDLLITSPGVPPKAKIITDAESRGIRIISEMEYARSFCEDSPLIAITGTNGKTTTTTLIHYILNKSGKKAVLAGNIGTPLSELVNTLDKDTIIVAELSSFQLDRIEKFRPDVAIILNISPDHLYYHETLENYKNAKFKISLNQNENNLLILNRDDKATLEIVEKTKAKVQCFSMSHVDWGIHNKSGKLLFKTAQHEEEELMPISEISIPGIHNAYNSMAAALAARAFEVRNENIRDCLVSFQGVEHRLEFVRTLHGVDFINDSKATNVNATWYALSSYKKPLVWIAGGRGDSNDYFQLDELVEKNVKCIVAIGEEQEAIFNHFCLKVRCIRSASMEEAVKAAQAEAGFGDIVLFTPACKSFDMFMNYEHRGEVFKEIVMSLV